MKKRINTNFLGLIALISGIILPALNQNAPTGNIADLTAEGKLITLSNISAQSWYLEKIDAYDAWKNGNGGTNIIVAVLDTGIDVNNEDLVGRVIDNINFSQSATSSDVNGHGTAVAGVIAASLEDGKGVTGVAYNASLLNVKVANDSGVIYPEAVAKGITWAIEKGAKVINLSFTLRGPNETVENAVNYAWSQGAVIIAAAGNTGSSNKTYPAAYQNVIAVAATEKDDSICKWSNNGNWISVGAPGVDIYTTISNGEYALKSGTSFAAPLVSGEAALLMAITHDVNGNGNTNDEVRAAILNNTDAGRINIEKAEENTNQTGKKEISHMKTIRLLP